ncbi:MAG: DUF5666 domain-containing protein [Terracidiphilus sp.]|jgi:hypothetical protein
MNRIAMKLRLVSAAVFVLMLGAAAFSQDAPAGQTPPQGPAIHNRGGYGGGFGGRGILGTVTEAAADHYIIKTDSGESYVVHFSVNTRILKQTVQHRGEGGQGGGNPPQAIKPTDIKVGDAISAMGEVDAAAKSVGAILIVQVDPERAKQMREAQANYGKTWLMGKVTAINDTKVILLGSVDNAVHSFVADENTSFRKHREPITLADVQVGDIVRAEGAVKDGVFVATSVNAMGMPTGGMPTLPRDAAPAPQTSAPQTK